MLVTALCALLVSGIMWALYIDKTHRMKKMTNTIPGPRGFPIVGNTLEGLRNKHDFLQYFHKLYNNYPKICRLWILQHLFVFVNNMDDYQTLLSDSNIHEKAYFYKYLDPFIGDGLLTTGANHTQNRKHISQIFNFSVLKTYVEIFNKYLDVMLNKLSENVGGEEFDINPILSFHSTYVIAETVMGKQPKESQVLDILSVLKWEKYNVISRLGRPWLHNEFLFRISKDGRTEAKNIERSKKLFNEILSDIAKDKEQGISGCPGLLTMLLEKREKNLCTEQYMCDEMYTILATGSDTSAGTVAFACWALSRHPDVQERVVQEMQQIFGGSQRPATFSDLQEMNYLEMVLKETMRLYPPGPIVGRKLAEDYKLGDYIIPAGANLMVYIMGIHRDPKYFPEPEKFDPDRFLPENTKDRNPLCYIPFSLGPRNCVGQKYGMLFMKLIISGLLRRYKLVAGSTPLTLDLQLTLTTTNGINIKLAERTNK